MPKETHSPREWQVVNDPVQRDGPDQRLFVGRKEERPHASLPVYIGSLEDPRAPERTLTENVSAHGARVISKRSWQPDEELLVTPETGEFPQVGRVIYCLQQAGDCFCLGIEFPDRAVKWAEFSSA